MDRSSSDQTALDITTPPDSAGERLDAFLANCLPHVSRTSIGRSITAGQVFVNGATVKPSYRISGGERVSGSVAAPTGDAPVPEQIPLDVLYDDADILAVNKPPGMVVHPAKGHWAGTLTSALAFHFSELSSLGGPHRPGIVHRLDRDTSGVILVAKHDRAHANLATQFEQRVVEKEYFAVVRGVPDRDRDVVQQPIGPHPYQREKMAIRHGHAASRPAETLYEVQERLRGFACLRVFPQTGRTHQIRVHLAHLGYPVLCDRLYAGHAQVTLGQLGGDPNDARVVLDRQALHARRIALRHPTTGQPLELVAPLATDIQRLLETLRGLKKPGKSS